MNSFILGVFCKFHFLHRQSSADKDISFFSFQTLYLIAFYFLIMLARTPSTILNKNGKRRHSYLFPSTCNMSSFLASFEVFLFISLLKHRLWRAGSCVSESLISQRLCFWCNSFVLPKFSGYFKSIIKLKKTFYFPYYWIWCFQCLLVG